MKKHDLIRLAILGLVVLVILTANCAKSPEQLKKEVLTQLIDYLNYRMPGSRFEIDPATAVVQPIGNNRYRITLKNTTFITDLTAVADMFSKHLPDDDAPYMGRDEAQIEELLLIFGPKEKYLDLLSIKGLNFEGGFRERRGNKSLLPGGLEWDKVRITMGKITFQDRDTSDPRTPLTTLEHLKIRSDGLTAQQDKISVLIDVEKIGKVDTGKEDGNLSAYILDKNAPAPDLQKALQIGAAISDLNIRLGKVNLSIKKNGIQLCDGTVEEASYMQFLKPDNTGKSFRYGHDLQFNNFKLSITGKRELQLLSDVKAFHLGYSVNNLSPETTQALLDITKIAFTSRTLVDDSELKALMMKFILEAIKSKAYLHFSISPFKHYFGEMNGEVELRLGNLMAGPLLAIKVTLCKVDDILNKLKEANIFPGSTLKKITEIISRYAVRQKNGDAVFIREMDANQLRAVVLKLNETMLPPLSR